ncbi:hypothetical protein JL101_028540 [Skermanella rosea]|uniref:hypothetical protein n=1 Tax=Skermanella rosea TaxID=1817965 RepID=UPI00193452D4|nr:hypothetical protein [Skermanella rosea]UEM03848.1 hypothetical protein JL101_028540 [Skermanella rosea]
MIRNAFSPAAAALLILGGCSGSDNATRWEPTRSAQSVAESECAEQVDVKMQLRGYPRRPSPETPQFSYRREIFAKCMRDKGYREE